jgi:hypothetical protein
MHLLRRYFVVQALETPCLTISKALVLSRLIAHSTLPLQLQQRLPWHADPILLRRFGRFLIAIAITCSIIGFVANAVAAAGQSAAARLYADAAADSSRSFQTTCCSAIAPASTVLSPIPPGSKVLKALMTRPRLQTPCM